MRKIIDQMIFSGLLLIFVVGFSGCVPLIVGAAAGAGGYAYISGAVEKEYDVAAVKLHKATLRALDAIDVVVQEDKNDRLNSRIIAKTASGKEVKVNIDAITERTSKLTVRYGLMGNEEQSRIILNAIEKKL